MDSQYLTANEAAEIARVTPTTVRAWLKSGQLHGVKLGKQWLTTREWIDAMTSSNIIEPTKDELRKRADAAREVADQLLEFAKKRDGTGSRRRRS